MLRTESLSSLKNFAMSVSESDSPLNALFLANPPVQNDGNVEFQSALMSEAEIASLLRVFMKYWK
jgi:hypothetical protein